MLLSGGDKVYKIENFIPYPQFAIMSDSITFDSGVYGDDEDSGYSSASTYWQSFDSMVLRSREEISKETRLLNEVCYPVGNFKITIGLSVASGMIPSVKIKSMALNLPEEQVTISLADYDWFEFLEIALKLANQDTSDAVQTITSTTENFTMSAAILLGEKIINLRSNNITLCFCANDVYSFADIGYLVKFRIDLVKKLDFRSFYDEFLNCMKAYNVEGDFLNIVKDVCKSNMTEPYYYMLELVQYNPKRLLNDFDRLCMVDDV